MATLASHLARLKDRLKFTDTPGLDAQVLMAHILGKQRTWVLSHLEAELADLQAQALNSAATRLEAGEPLPYVLGEWEFFGLPFTITPQVLIPRPETELLVETALSWLDKHPERRMAADIGTGSGCIAVSLAKKVSDLRVVATDISDSALQVASENCLRHKVTPRVQLLEADLMDGMDQRFDLICANLPYIPSAVLHKLAVYGREPALALDGGERGLDLIARLLRQAPGSLFPGGLLLLEIETSQGEEVLKLASRAFTGGEIHIFQDLAGHDRVVYINS